MWFWLRLVMVVLLGVAGFPEIAAADACHAGPPLEALGLGLHVSTSLEFASYDNDRGEGNYAGVVIGAAYRHDFLRLRSQLPAYRLERNDEVFYGPGDVLFGAEAALYRDGDSFATGVGVALTVPTGDADEDLGMGHFMVMPGLWAELTHDRVFVQAQVVYGRALASQDDPAHEHAGHAGHPGQGSDAPDPGPIVNPMNLSEISGRLSAGYRTIDWLRVRTGVDAAVPVADDQGKSRLIAVLAVDLLPDPFNVALEGQVPFVGDPFTAKALLSAGFRF